MKILVTGAEGQLGSELVKMIQTGHGELGRTPQELRDAEVKAVDLPSFDIADTISVGKYVEEHRPDIIINCAAYTNVDGCESDRDIAFRVNALGARNIAVAADSIGAALVHISTDYVFDGISARPYCEWDMCNPQNVYGYTKYLGEQYIRDFCDKYFIVRTAWLYGCTGRNFVKTIIRTAKEKGKLKVVDDQRGNPTNAADLAHHILKLAPTREYGIYHCTAEGECSWFEFAREFLGLAEINCEIEPCTTQDYPLPAKRPAYSALENRMLRCTVGDEMRHWRDAIAAFVSYLKKTNGVVNI